MRAWLLIMVLASLVACETKQPAAVLCADLTRGCHLDGQVLEVHADRMPIGLQPFVLTVHAPQARAVYAEFLMPGMEMGLNRYRLERAPGGAWRGRITLPVCVTGRRDWLLVLDVDGERHALAFVVG
jgi:hypothetical protein